MAGSRTTDTFPEGLRKLLGTLTDLKVLPDADLAFLVNLETQIIAKIREPMDAAAQAGASQVPMGPPPQMGPPMGGMPGVPNQMAARGVMPGPTMPSNPDELRRVLSQG